MVTVIAVIGFIGVLWTACSAGGRKAKRAGGSWNLYTGKKWKVGFVYDVTVSSADETRSPYSLVICRHA